VRVLHTQLLCNAWKDLIQQIANQEEYFSCDLPEKAFEIMNFLVFFLLSKQAGF